MLRPLFLLPVIILSGLLIWFLYQNPPRILLTEEQRFVKFTEEVFRSEVSSNTLNLHYTVSDPSAYSIDGDRITIGNASLNARKNGYAAAENYYNMLQNFDRSKLSVKRRLTYDAFSRYLETELSAAELLLYDEPLSPTLGIQAQLPVLLAEYRFRTKGDIEDYLCLLSQVPDYFKSILSYEQEKSRAGLFMNEECALEVIRQCKDFIAEGDDNYLSTIFNEKIDAVKNLTVDEKTAYKTRNQSLLNGYVIPAYQELISGIASMEDSGVNEYGLYYLPKGQEYYRYLIKNMVGDDRTVEEIEEEIKNQMVDDFTAIQQIMKTYYSGGQGGNPDSVQNTAARTIQTDSSVTALSTDDPVTMLNDLRQKITGDFPLLPSVSCQVKYVHPSLQQYLSPAFYLTSPIDDYARNVIYINPSGSYNSLELYTTLAHEGYPGHLYQSVFFASTEPDLLRYLLDIGGYTEGWATYVEMYAYSLWEEDPVAAQLGQKNRSFTLGLASLLDIGIHYRGYSPEQVTAFLEKLGFGSDTADSLYQSILQAPANYLQYYVGYLNFSRLRTSMQQKLRNRFSLKEFHRLILEAGPLPFSLLEGQMAELPDI